MTKRTWLVTTAALLLACAPGPADIHWGVQECAQCQMVIADERFAGQVVDRRGNTYGFDAIECMAAFINEARVTEGDVHSVWVADGRSAWVPVEAVTFVHSDGIRSPMGGGYAARTDRATAAALQAEAGGSLLSWADLLERVAASDHGHSHAGAAGGAR
jgi:copper chaperone NosL